MALLTSGAARVAVPAFLSCFISVACSSDDHGSAPTDGGTNMHEAGPEPPDSSPKEAAAPPHDAAPETSTPSEASTDAGPGYPPLLSETGLFKDIVKGTINDGVLEYQPKYPLWSDGATKRRWVSLPPGSTIDTSDMNFWVYPQGTRMFKEFTVGGKRLETRMLYKAGPTSDDWVMIAYAWRTDLSDADAVPAGVENAGGTTHDIPSLGDCAFCHGNMKDRLLGFGAIQLSHDLPGVKLTDLIKEGALSDPPAGNFTLPGTAEQSSALGYLHGNCGDCHNAGTGIGVSMQLWEDTKALGSVQGTDAFQTAVDQPMPGEVPNRIVAGDPADSMIYVRMSVRGSGQMPPVCTKEVDPTGLETIRKFILSLGPNDGGTEGGAPRRDSGP